MRRQDQSSDQTPSLYVASSCPGVTPHTRKYKASSWPSKELPGWQRRQTRTPLVKRRGKRIKGQRPTRELPSLRAPNQNLALLCFYFKYLGMATQKRLMVQGKNKKSRDPISVNILYFLLSLYKTLYNSTHTVYAILYPAFLFLTQCYFISIFPCP